VLQPLDVGVYGPFKQCFKQTILEWNVATGAEMMSKYLLPSKTYPAWMAAATPERIRKAFRNTGRTAVTTTITTQQQQEQKLCNTTQQHHNITTQHTTTQQQQQWQITATKK